MVLGLSCFVDVDVNATQSSHCTRINRLELCFIFLASLHASKLDKAHLVHLSVLAGVIPLDIVSAETHASRGMLVRFLMNIFMRTRCFPAENRELFISPERYFPANSQSVSCLFSMYIMWAWSHVARPQNSSYWAVKWNFLEKHNCTLNLSDRTLRFGHQPHGGPL